MIRTDEDNEIAYLKENAPSWASCIARDEDGRWVYFEEKPTAQFSRGRREGKWYELLGRKFMESSCWNSRSNIKWSDSLVEFF